jgi:biotin synthase
MVCRLEESTDIGRLTIAEIVELLQAEGDLQQRLFAWARRVRQQQGADKVVLRGVIEVSSYCQKNCSYCAMRGSNSHLPRYRLSAEQVLAIAEDIQRSGISTIFLQSGQDPQYDSVLERIIPEIKQRLNLDVLLCVGERELDVYQRFAAMGVSGYILKFETSDPHFYREVANVSPERRLQCLRWIREAHLCLGTGNIVGLPKQSVESLARDILFALSIQPDYVSTAPFIPNEQTPFEHDPPGNINLTLNTIALLRIALKKCLIPAVSALEKIIPRGQVMGLNAGANVLTINFSPNSYRKKYAIYSKNRFIVSLDHALATIRQASLEPQWQSVRCPVALAAS